MLVLVALLVTVLGAPRQVLVNPSFENSEEGVFGWQPYLSGFYVDSDSGRARSGESSISLTPHHFFGFHQHVKLDPSGGKVVSVSGWANAEWGYASSARISVVFKYLDGSRSSSSLSFKMGVTGYQRRCASYLVPNDNPIVAVTVYGIASPLSSNFGTIFFDDFEVFVGDDELVCGDDITARMPKTMNDANAYALTKTGPDPLGWKDLNPQNRVCVVVSMRAGHVQHLNKLSNSMGDIPLVAAIYLNETSVAESVFEKASEVAVRAKVLLVGNVLKKRRRSFPINVLRNFGQEHCPHGSTHALHLEEGMLLSQSFWDHLPVLEDDVVLIVPSFDLDTFEIVADKTALKALPNVTALQLGHHRLASYSTNLTRFMQCEPGKNYRIDPIVSGALAVELGQGVVKEVDADVMENEPAIFNRHFVPVMIVPIAHAAFDVRFDHQGHERVSFVADWMIRGGQFLVLCDAFVTRNRALNPMAGIQHAPPLTTKQANQIWKTYYAFLGEKLEISTGFSPELFRTMPFVSRSKDHRLDAPFWRRASLAFGTIFVAGLILRQLLTLPAKKLPGSRTIKDL